MHAQFQHFFMSHAGWFQALGWFILTIGLVQNIIYLMQLPLAWLELREHSQKGDTESSWELLISDIAMPISLIVPAFNEEAVIVHSIRSMLALQYNEIEIIVVNDGSNDGTLEVLIDAFMLKPVTRAHELTTKHAPVKTVYASSFYPQLLVLDKENGGSKADAMNAGINFSRCPLFCIVDADSLLEAQALLRSVRPFMENPKETVAVGGTIRVVNDSEVKAGRVTAVHLPKRFLPLVQTMEYIRAYLMARMALSRIGVLTIISGAFGIFRRNIAVEVGGFSHNTVGEDLEFILKIHRLLRDRKQKYIMRYVPEPVCWTEVPETLSILSNQRKRWQRGSLESFFKHCSMLLNPKYGRIGVLGFTHILIVDIIGPVVEILGYVLIPLFYFAGLFHLDFLLAYAALSVVFGITISVASLILEEVELKRVPRARDLFILAGVAIIENFGYRQLNNFWRVMGWWEFLRRRQGWGEMKRKGFTAQD